MSKQVNWLRWNLWLPKAMKDLLETESLRIQQSQASVVRKAIMIYLENTLEESEELEAVRIALRQRKERLKLETAKDSHRTSMIPVQVWGTIQKEIHEYKKLGILSSDDYDAFIKRIEDNKDSIGLDNPERERIIRKLDALIEKLRQEQASLSKRPEVWG